MNDRMQAKIETCLELVTERTATGRAETFKKNVLKVTAISPARFDDLALTADAYRLLQEGDSVKAVLNKLF